MMYFFFFNDTATTEIYTLSLHDALPIYGAARDVRLRGPPAGLPGLRRGSARDRAAARAPAQPAHARAAGARPGGARQPGRDARDRKSTRLNSSHANISYAVFCLKKKKNT